MALFNRRLLFLFSSIALLVASASPTIRAEGAGDVAGVNWDRKLFDYQRPEKLPVEMTTPTDAQMNFWMRPPQATGDEPAPQATGLAKPRTVGWGNVIHLRFKDATGDIVPAVLCTPRGKPGPFPLVIAIHGLLSNKMQVCGQVGATLLKRGYAVLAADLPCHGERPGDPFDMVDGKHWDKTFPLHRKAVIDIRQLIDLAPQLPDIDTHGGVVLVGYSLGSWVSAVAGPADDRVRAMVLMVGGALDVPADALKIPEVAACDPRVALAHFAGRPLLLLNGKTDDIVAPELSERLYAGCPEPKKQIWYDSGHFLPQAAFEEAARWIAEDLKPGKADKPVPALSH